MRSARDNKRRPKIRTRIRSGPVNTALIVAIGFAGLSYVAWPREPNGFLMTMSGISALYGAVLGGAAAKSLIRDYRLRSDLAKASIVSDDHGSARTSTREERVAVGMADFRNGELLGIDDDGYALWRPSNAPFALIEMPPGAGKTSTLVIGSILNRALLGSSVIVPDIKQDLGPMLIPTLLREGIEVWNVNPAPQHKECAASVVLNPYQPVIDSVWGDAEARKNAFKYAADFGVVHVPQTKGDQHPYFTLGARRVVVIVILLLAYFDPANCTPTGVYNLLSDPGAFLNLCIKVQRAEPFDGNDDLLASLKSEALSMLHRAKKNKDNFSSFIEQATQQITPFNPSGWLGHYGREAFLNIGAIRNRPVVVFISTPLSHMREFAPFVSLINQNIISACKAKPDGHPVHIVGEEALNYRFNDLVADLETMRQLRVTADFYIQSFAGLERNYGREAAAAIESYADVRVYAGLNSYDRAKHVSSLLSDETLLTQDVSHGTTPHELNLSSKEIGRPLMKPDEILAMPRDEAWVFVRGVRPTKVRLTTYAQVWPWSEWVGPSPISGTRLTAKPILRVNYPKGEAPCVSA